MRESINQLLMYDTSNNLMTLVNTKGITVAERKDHTATVYGKLQVPSIHFYFDFLTIAPTRH